MSTRGIELELPDLPEVPISLGPVPGEAPAARTRGAGRLWESLVSWLPLMLMGCLALATWWLVKNAPQPAGAGAAPAARQAPDYTMTGFTLQRFAADGQLKLEVEGTVLRHLPQSEQVEIDEARILMLSPEGRPLRAQALQVTAKDDGTLVHLRGQAEVRSVTGGGQTLEMSSESLQLFPPEQRISGDQPVEMRVGTHRLAAGGIEADQRTGVVSLNPPLRGVFTP